MSSINIANYLDTMAKKNPMSLALAVQKSTSMHRLKYTEWSFEELNRESNRVAIALRQQGVTKGMHTILMVPPGIELFSICFALFRLGAVPIMVDPGIGLKNLKKCLTTVKPKAFIGSAKAHAARMMFGWGKGQLKVNLTTSSKISISGKTLEKILPKGDMTAFDNFTAVEGDQGDTAAILFTSGSTGTSKGVVYTHRMFEAQINVMREVYDIKEGERDLATFPLFGLFGPALGMAAIVPDMNASKPIKADPKKLLAAVRLYETTNMFASPAILDVIGEYAYKKGIVLPTLKRVISAGAPARPESLHRFTAILNSGVEILTSYGATEALPVSVLGSRELLLDTVTCTEKGAGVCVGYAATGMDIKIIRLTDDVIEKWDKRLLLPTGQIGEIVVCGDVVSAQYFDLDEATALAKIYCHQTGRFYHRMGDLGYLDDLNRLWMCGRKTHRVITAKEVLYTIACERILDVHPEVKRTALVGIPDVNSVYQQPVLCVELNDHVLPSRHTEIRQQLHEIALWNKQTKNIKDIRFHPKFPVDIRHNAKIFREKLAVWAMEED
ncbi:MAG: fatty acid CoA ligase family protein [Mariprofundaceae bacterium]|nr:fatty acid CoA ligase family protein [Mariprofundaceae bacterium]